MSYISPPILAGMREIVKRYPWPMRRPLAYLACLLLLALTGAAALALVRRALGARPPGTPTSWPQVPRKPAD